jgi:hypothetical protein
MTWLRTPKTGLNQNGTASYIPTGLDDEAAMLRYHIERLGPTRWKLLSWDPTVTDNSGATTGGFVQIEFTPRYPLFPRLKDAQACAERLKRRRTRAQQ